jgi:hypothetical protein
VDDGTSTVAGSQGFRRVEYVVVLEKQQRDLITINQEKIQGV